MSESAAHDIDAAFGASLDAAIDTKQAWGRFTPAGAAATTLALCAGMPTSARVFYSLNKLIRGPLKNATPRVFDVQRFGLNLRLLTRGNYCETSALFAPGFYDVPERAWIAANLPAGGVFLDVGGNVGLYSLTTAHTVADARVITVEPDPRLAARMHFNARTNGLAVEHHEVALGDEEGRASLLRSGQQSGANRLASAGELGGDRLDVRLMPLVSLCRENTISHIDVMKIDIEGYEKPVLDHFFAHAPEELWPKGIVIEHSHDVAGVVENLVERHGYRMDEKTSRNVALKRP